MKSTFLFFMFVVFTTPLGPVFAQQMAPAHASNNPVNVDFTNATMNKLDTSGWGCDFAKMTSPDGSIIGACLAVGAYYLLMKPMFMLASGMSLLFNFTLFKLVAGMGGIINSIEGIDVAWKVLRDMANVFLVFLMVYVGIATILGISGYGYKQLLFKIIVAALFVNFSITFAKIVIDVSNITALEAYSMFISDTNGAGKMTPNCLADTGSSGPNRPNLNADVDNTCITNGIAGAFWSTLNVTSMFNFPESAGTSAANKDWMMFFSAVLGAVFLLILAFLFGAAAFLLITRFVILTYLIIISPIALVAWITGVSSMGKNWWESLLSQSIFAPVLILSWWIAYKMMDSLSGQVSGSLADGSTLSVSAMSMMVTYIIGAGFLLAGLVAAKKLGAHGATTIMNTGNKWSKAAAYGTAGLAGAYVVGGTSSKLAQWHKESSAQAHQKDADGNYLDNSMAARFQRTKFGSKINRGVQATVAAPSKSKALGGGKYSFAERRDSAKKAATEQQKGFDTMNRKTELKSAIEASVQSTSGLTEAGRAHIERAQKTMKDLKHTDIKEHADLFKENPDRLAHVSSNTFKQVVENKDGTFTDAEIQKFREARLTQHEKTIKENPAKASETYKKIIDNKDGAFTESQVEEYKAKRSKYFAEMEPEKVTEMVNKSSPKELAEQDPSFLGRYEVIKQLDIPTMSGMIKSGALSKEKRSVIRNALEREYNQMTDPNASSLLSEEEKGRIVKLYDWLNDDNRMAI